MTKKQKQASYSNLRKQVLQKIKRLEKSTYGKDIQNTINYYKERLKPVSRLKDSRDLAYAMKEAEKANQINWTQTERKRKRKERVKWLQQEIGKDRVKNIKDVRDFEGFMESVRNFSIGTIYDSERAISIYQENPELNKKELLEKYDEYRKDFFSRRSGNA
nr:MAG TPA: hypothetical protein [Caudoviricetes sp.]